MTTLNEAEVEWIGVDLQAESGPDLVRSQVALFGKRLLDVVAAGLLLLALLPLFGVICLAVKFTSRGPVIFRQERVAMGGRSFTVLKFRTMRDGTHREVSSCERQWAEYAANDFKLAADDHRITAVGRILRKSSLDELPQLWNVVRGDMSLVGVRPLLRVELEARPELDRYCYCSMRPGMTGLWQVEGRSSVSGLQRLTLDQEYVVGWTFWGDVRLLLRTPIAVLRAGHAK